MNLTTFTAAALFAVTVYQFQNLVRYLRALDWNGVLGILLAVLAGIAAVALGAHSAVVDQLRLIDGGPVLANLDGGAQIMLGIGVGSAASGGADLLKALDGTRSSAKPKLIPDDSGPDA
jgi:hypothetical protein